MVNRRIVNNFLLEPVLGTGCRIPYATIQGSMTLHYSSALSTVSDAGSATHSLRGILAILGAGTGFGAAPASSCHGLARRVIRVDRIEMLPQAKKTQRGTELPDISFAAPRSLLSFYVTN